MLVKQLLKKQRIISGFRYYTNGKKETPTSNIAAPSEEVTKESLQWRTSFEERKGEWFSKLKVFSSDHNNTDYLKFIQTFSLSPSAIKEWWKSHKLQKEIVMQSYIPERNSILGNDLAAAHFVVFRGGSVKFVGEDKWVKRDENLEYDLPKTYVANKYIEAINCSTMNLHYEGLENLKGLKKLKSLNLKNSKYIDDWCIDRICRIFQDNLTILDLRNCPNVTERGIGALYKLKKLKTLYVDDIKIHKSYELTCLLLEELLPDLNIKM